ncbi:hemerythrin domain-containing protein [Streptomyces sp. NPDC003077]|uniref:hemerythrin domain-containing protein n=1 Tax=Streptomyces sp. NPDC003077 TaxID=3154443 RepID=UPI0033A838FB
MSEPRTTGPATGEQDVVALLMRQHEEIRHLFHEVETAKDEARRDAFRRLVHLLAVHETAEEEVVHPYARHAFGGGEEVVNERLLEEKKAKEALARLEHLDPDDAGFLPQLQALRRDVEAHADAEEREEFGHLRAVKDATKLRGLAAAVRAAEAVAPTHPHSGTESAAKNLAAGPFAAVADRVKDAMRRAGEK